MDRSRDPKKELLVTIGLLTHDLYRIETTAACSKLVFTYPLLSPFIHPSPKGTRKRDKERERGCAMSSQPLLEINTRAIYRVDREGLSSGVQKTTL